MAISYSPLRYPGGKSRLTNFIKLVLKKNGMEGGIYAEPFAGGAGVAIGLLFSESVRQVFINDIDSSIYAFWYSVLHYTDEFCKKINDTTINMEEWHRQKEIFSQQDSSDLFELGFATFFLNRTNRSGILNAGVIGGLKQNGEWKLDARFNKVKLIQKIQKIAGLESKIVLSNLDARQFIKESVANLPSDTLVYLDPPYFHKGQKLYLNALEPDDHILIAHSVINEIQVPWIVSYDSTKEISDLYSGYKQSVYPLSYSAANHYQGKEIIISEHNLMLPDIPNPFIVSKADFAEEYKLAS